MTRGEHLKAIYIIGSKKIGKHHGLIMLCSGPDCAGTELFARDISAGAVAVAADAHIDGTGEVGDVAGEEDAA